MSHVNAWLLPVQTIVHVKPLTVFRKDNSPTVGNEAKIPSQWALTYCTGGARVCAEVIWLVQRWDTRLTTHPFLLTKKTNKHTHTHIKLSYKTLKIPQVGTVHSRADSSVDFKHTIQVAESSVTLVFVLMFFLAILPPLCQFTKELQEHLSSEVSISHLYKMKLFTKTKCL